jgi:outer membrane receptor protein involved in Fe transport
LGYADVNMEQKNGAEDQTGMEGLTPGLGVIWQPAESLRLRAAAGRTIKRPYVANQTLQPTQLAGFNEQFDDFDGTRADWLGVAVDVRASEAVRLGAEMRMRRLTRELLPDVTGAGELLHRHANLRDDLAMGYLYWAPTDRIAASLEVIGEYYSAKERDNPPDDVVDWWTLTTPLQLTYTIPAGWFATARTAVVVQDVDVSDDGQKEDLDSHGVLVDLSAGYRLPKRRGVIALELANVLDEHLSFRDDSFRTARGQVNPRFVPSRTFLATVTLNF